jgi:hypothetical protein
MDGKALQTLLCNKEHRKSSRKHDLHRVETPSQVFFIKTRQCEALKTLLQFTKETSRLIKNHWGLGKAVESELLDRGNWMSVLSRVWNPLAVRTL